MASNPTYDAETLKRIKSPNYFIVIKNWGGSDSYFSMKPVQNPTRSYTSGLTGIKANTQRITPEEGKSSIGTLGFGLQDKGDKTTALLASPIRKKEVQLWAGYDGIDEDKYIQLTTNLVDEVSMGSDLINYIFKTADLQRSIKKEVFNPKVTSLTALLSAGATTATVNDTSSFQTVVHPSLGTVGYIRINDEIIKWTAKTATTFTIARGQFGTTNAEHASGDEIKEVIAFEEHPISVALKVLTSTGADTNGAYDTLPSHWALGITQTLVDIASWEAEAEAWLNYNKTDLTYGYQFRFIYDAKIAAKKFIEDEILKVLNAYAPISVDGAISFKAFAPPVPFVDLDKLDETVISIKQMDAGLSAVINSALFEYDYDPVQNKYLKNIEYLDGQSISDHGESDTFTVKSKGIRSSLDGDDIVLNRWNRLKQRYKNPPPTFKVKAFYSQHLKEVGQMINFSHTKLPDLSTGVKGLSEKVTEITNKSFDILGGALHYDLMLTGFGQRYGLWAPDTVPTYDSATADEKERYMFLADASEKLGAANDEAKRYA